MVNDDIVKLSAHYNDLEIFILNATDLLKDVELTLRTGECSDMADEIKTLYRNIENFAHLAYQQTKYSDNNIKSAYACLGYKGGNPNDKT